MIKRHSPAVTPLFADKRLANAPGSLALPRLERWHASDPAIYVTINIEIEGSVRRPYQIFINSEALEHYAWTVL